MRPALVCGAASRPSVSRSDSTERIEAGDRFERCRPPPAFSNRQGCPLSMNSSTTRRNISRARGSQFGDGERGHSAILSVCACGGKWAAPIGLRTHQRTHPCAHQDARPTKMRAITIETGFTRHAEGSVLIGFGDTKVLCTASVERGVPPWLRGKGEGWVTGEYSMLPRATHTRGAREAAKGKQSGRTQEIPAAYRAEFARRGRSAEARRAADHLGLRRDPGRWRHAHGGDFGAQWIALAAWPSWPDGIGAISSMIPISAQSARAFPAASSRAPRSSIWITMRMSNAEAEWQFRAAIRRQDRRSSGDGRGRNL